MRPPRHSPGGMPGKLVMEHDGTAASPSRRGLPGLNRWEQDATASSSTPAWAAAEVVG